jgi:medium-chain acyl-[acyl-carrier-protein] hydrolase
MSMTRTVSRNGWIVTPRPNPNADVRLFCFHYAGGSATLFQKWADSLPPLVELCAIQLPGRGARIGEPLLSNVAAVVDPLASAMTPYLDKPFMFFGHSMGALLSYEVAHRLREMYALQPEHLFVSGRRAPQFPAHTAYHSLSDSEFMQRLHRLNGTPKAILENAELMQLMLPMLRADFQICETHRYQERMPLTCPISALGGLQDPDVEYSHLTAWRSQTTGQFNLHMFDGDHFFIQSATLAVLQVLARRLHYYAKQRYAGAASFGVA